MTSHSFCAFYGCAKSFCPEILIVDDYNGRYTYS